MKSTNVNVDCFTMMYHEKSKYHIHSYAWVSPTLTTILLLGDGYTDDMSCACGHKKEDAKHFLLECKLYQDKRMVMFNGIADTVNNQNLKTTTLLYGKEDFLLM